MTTLARLDADRVEAHPSLLVGEHPAMRRLRHLITRAATFTTPVLIEGPTGSGKELVVQELYRQSGLRGALVCVNAATLPEGLAEAELFGVVRGAYTGAVQSRPGRLSDAREGMLYLDESADLPASIQAKLLRAVETGELSRLGSSSLERVRFRLVVSVQESADRLMRRGRWRPDFRYRVSGIVLRVPPLSERLSDLPLLSQFFLKGLRRPALEADSIALLEAFSWPGNVRQLRQVLERALFLAGPDPMSVHILADALEPELGTDSSITNRRPSGPELATLLEEAGGRVERLGRILGVSRATAYRWLSQAAIPTARVT